MLRIAWSPLYPHPLPEHHRFPMLKYELIPEQLLYEGTAGREQFFAPRAMDESVVQKTHCADYWNRLKNLRLDRQAERRTGFPQSARLVEREITIAQGTLDCAWFALEHGAAFNVSGGTHHAYRDRGEGFCLLNDVALAANEIIATGACQRVIVIDLDVHQGNGTASIFNERPEVFTLSFHGADNFPLHKERSDLDVPLPTGMRDDNYLSLLADRLPAVLDTFKPDLAFYIAGVDVLESDRLGKLSLSLHGCKERDRLVFEACSQRRLPVVTVMGGGYSRRISDIVQAHCQTFREATRIFG